MASAICATTCSSRMAARSDPSLALCSARFQSMAEPSATADATSSNPELSTTGHLLSESRKRASDGHASGGWRRLAKEHRDLLVREVELAPSDDQLTLVRLESFQRRVVPLQRLLPDGQLDGGRIGREMIG